jgi:hypothetical protein
VVYWSWDVGGSITTAGRFYPEILHRSWSPDHILLLEKSLNHQEYVLAHCQPAYLSHLNVTISYFRAQRDRILLGLTTVTIAVFTMQLCSGTPPFLTSEVANKQDYLEWISEYRTKANKIRSIISLSKVSIPHIGISSWSSASCCSSLPSLFRLCDISGGEPGAKWMSREVIRRSMPGMRSGVGSRDRA